MTRPDDQAETRPQTLTPEPPFDPAVPEQTVLKGLAPDPKQPGSVPPVKPPKPEKWGKAIRTTKTGVATLKTLDEQIRFAKLLIEKKMVSSSFEDAASVVLGIQYAKALRLEPMVALKMMYVIDGRPTLFGDGPLALAWRSRMLQSCEEFWIDDNGERISADAKNLKARPFGSVTRLLRVGDDKVQEDFFTRDDLAVAKMDQTRHGKKEVWERYERLMMRYKGRTVALKSKMTDTTAGLFIAEYDFDFSPQAPEVPPTQPQQRLAEGGSMTDFLEQESDLAKEMEAAHG